MLLPLRGFITIIRLFPELNCTNGNVVPQPNCIQLDVRFANWALYRPPRRFVPPDMTVLVTETWPTSIVAFVIVGGLGDADRSGATVTVDGADVVDAGIVALSVTFIDTE